MLSLQFLRHLHMSSLHFSFQFPLSSQIIASRNDKQKNFLLLILMQLIKRRKMNILLVLYHADDMASVADKNIYYPSKNDFSLVNKSNNPICITRNLKVTSFTMIGSIYFTNIHTSSPPPTNVLQLLSPSSQQQIIIIHINF